MKNTLFNWQGEAYESLGFPLSCPWCGTATRSQNFAPESDTTTHRYFDCPLCGWYFRKYIRYSESRGCFSGSYTYAILKEFEDKQPGIYLKELQKSLSERWTVKSRMKDIKFENYLADVLKSRGISLVFKLVARDGKKVLFILDDGKQSFLLEAYKEPKNSKLKLNLVSVLVGLHINWTRKKACFVTDTDRYFIPNITKINFKKLTYYGYRADFKLASEIMAQLGLYNKKFPPLDKLTKTMRGEIIETNKMN